MTIYRNFQNRAVRLHFAKLQLYSMHLNFCMVPFIFDMDLVLILIPYYPERSHQKILR